jgi:hypothetical protein
MHTNFRGEKIKEMITVRPCAVQKKKNNYTSLSFDWPRPLEATPDSLVGDVGALLEVIVLEL